MAEASPTVHVHVTVVKDVAPEHQEEWLKMAEEISVETWKEDGCLKYEFVRSSLNENRFVIVEEWESHAHLEAHFQAEHFTRLVPLMDGISKTVELDASTKALPIHREYDALRINDRKIRNGRILVLYDTSTGSTRDMAVLIAEGAALVDKMDIRVRVVPGPAAKWEEDMNVKRDSMHPFATHSDVFWADAVAVGTPTNLGGISYRMKQFWDEFSQEDGWSTTDGKIGTAFTSQGGHGGGGELTCMAMQVVLMNFGFSCFGTTDYVSFMDTMHYGACIAKKPRDEISKMKCRRQGQRLAEFVGYYINGRDDTNPMLTKNWETKHWGSPGIPPRGADIEELVKRTKMSHTSEEPFTRRTKKALIFTKMEDYVHDSTPAMASWVMCKLAEFGWKGVVTDDRVYIEDGAKLDQFDVIIFLNNSGQIFEKTDFLLKHIEAGKGVVGVHAAVASFLNGKDASGATIMKPTSDIFETIFGSHFENHPPVQKGIVQISHGNKLGANLASVPSTFSHTDEFFNFTKNVCDDPDTTVVAYLDESTYEGGRMGEKHPIAWYRTMGEKKAPIFYSGLGHFSHFYNGEGPPHVATILEAGLRYCCGTP